MRKRSHRGYYNWNFAYPGKGALATWFIGDGFDIVLKSLNYGLCSSARPHWALTVSFGRWSQGTSPKFMHLFWTLYPQRQELFSLCKRSGRPWLLFLFCFGSLIVWIDLDCQSFLIPCEQERGEPIADKKIGVVFCGRQARDSAL